MTSPQDPPSDATKPHAGAPEPATAKNASAKNAPAKDAPAKTPPAKDRLAAALRENLRRRRAQRAGRAQRVAPQPAGPDEG